MHNIGVVGSREYGNEALVRLFVDALPWAMYPKEICVVSGGAKGVDSWAANEAELIGLPTEVINAEWKVNGSFRKNAGMMRNIQLINRCDSLLAFWDGVSSGTRHTISLAKKEKIPYLVVRSNVAI